MTASKNLWILGSYWATVTSSIDENIVDLVLAALLAKTLLEIPKALFTAPSATSLVTPDLI